MISYRNPKKFVGTTSSSTRKQEEEKQMKITPNSTLSSIKSSSASSASSLKIKKPSSKIITYVNYIFLAHGAEICNQELVIPKDNEGNKIFIQYYTNKYEALYASGEDVNKICNNEKVVSPSYTRKSGNTVNNILFTGDVKLSTGLAICHDGIFTNINPLRDGGSIYLNELLDYIINLHTDLLKIYTDKIYKIKISLLSCRLCSTINEKGELKSLQKNYKNYFIEPIDPDVKLANEFNKIELTEGYALKKWKITDSIFEPVECGGIEKSKQFGCSLQTLVYLGELNRNDENIKKEILEATIYKNPTVNRIFQILNDPRLFFKNYNLFNKDYQDVTLNILNDLCKELDKNEATLIKLNRIFHNISHVVTLIKKENNVCYIFDPQQTITYSYIDFKNFLFNQKNNNNIFGSFDVIYQKINKRKPSNNNSKRTRSNIKKQKLIHKIHKINIGNPQFNIGKNFNKNSKTKKRTTKKRITKKQKTKKHSSSSSSKKMNI